MKIKFLPQNIEVDIDPNRSVLQIASDNNIPIKSICKGVPSCAECRIKVIEGDHNVLPPTKAELTLIGSSYHLDSRRLSCQMKCYGPVTIDLSEHQDIGEANSKKIRGFKSQKNIESRAVQDTLVLTEGATHFDPQEENLSQQSSGSQQDSESISKQKHSQSHQERNRSNQGEGNRNQQSRNEGRSEQNRNQNSQQGKDQRHGKNQQRNQGQNKGQNQNQNQNRGRHPNQGRHQSQNQGQQGQGARGQNQKQGPRPQDQQSQGQQSQNAGVDSKKPDAT